MSVLYIEVNLWSVSWTQDEPTVTTETGVINKSDQQNQNLFEALRPSQQFFSHVGTEPTLPGFNQYCRELMCLAQGHNTVPPVGIEPRTSRFGVRCSTTIQLRF